MTDFKKYIEVLNEAIHLTEDYIEKLPEIGIYKTILTQLLYVSAIMAQNRNPTEDEVEPVTFGIVAIKNFDEDDEPYRTMLINLYGDFERFSEE